MPSVLFFFLETSTSWSENYPCKLTVVGTTGHCRAQAMAHTQLHTVVPHLFIGSYTALQNLYRVGRVAAESTQPSEAGYLAQHRCKFYRSTTVDKIPLHSKQIWEEVPRDVEKAIRWFLHFLLRGWDLTNILLCCSSCPSLLKDQLSSTTLMQFQVFPVCLGGMGNNKILGRNVLLTKEGNTLSCSAAAPVVYSALADSPFPMWQLKRGQVTVGAFC